MLFVYTQPNKIKKEKMNQQPTNLPRATLTM